MEKLYPDVFPQVLLTTFSHQSGVLHADRVVTARRGMK